MIKCLIEKTDIMFNIYNVTYSSIHLPSFLGAHMEFKNLSTFIRVAELENFSAAAEELGFSQSTVTAQIQQLEEQLCTTLFDRNGKRISLSAAGRKFLEYSYRIRQAEEEAAEYFLKEQEPEGLLRIGIMESVCASGYDRYLMDFMMNYPKVKVKIEVCTTFRAIDGLEKGELDVIITLDHKIVREGWMTSYDKEEDIVFFCNKDHLLAKKKTVKVQELLSEDFLMVEERCNYREAFEQDMQKLGKMVKCRLEIGHSGVIIDAVERGVGISLLPRFTVSDALERGKVAEIKLADYNLQMSLQIIHDKKRWKSSALREFLNMFYHVKKS